MGIGIISYFVESYAGYDSVLDKFKYMYGQDSQFINPENMTEISKTINSKFLEVAIN